MENYDSIIDSPIFLHFLNRELIETINAKFLEQDIIDFIKVAVLLNNSFAYIGNALVWECFSLFPNAIVFLSELEKLGMVHFVGGEITLNTFLEKRRRLYKYDKKRYPIYFNDKYSQNLWGRTPIITNGDTTKILSTNFFEFVNDYGDGVKENIFKAKDIDIIFKQLSFRLKNGYALTYSLFKDTKLSNSAKMQIKKMIVLFYTKRYLSEFNGKIINGLPSISDYEFNTDVDLLYYNFNFNFIFLEKLGILKNLGKELKEVAYNLLNLKTDKIYRQLLIEIRRATAGIKCYSINKETNIYITLNNYFENNNHFENSSHFENNAYNLYSKLIELSINASKNIFFREGYNSMSNFERTILILAANELEYRIARKVAKNYGYICSNKITENEDFSYIDCVSANSNSVKIYIARTYIGSLNTVITIQHLKQYLNPKYVIMGGICVGLKPSVQRIGDILVSEKISQYDFIKETETKRILRGEIISSSRFLRDRFGYQKEKWTKSNVEFGLIVSSSDLANSRAYIERVLDELPDSIGYEMEGAGLMQICQMLQDKWILVKAISDWGYDKTDSNQENAAINSFEYIFDTIKEQIENL